jgi:1-acyl-sn-glycerol-3-phosphate acyltransferase
MQNIVVDKPYSFIPPRFSPVWHWMIRKIVPRYLRKEFGITSTECRGQEKLKASLEAGHGVLLVGNHCRPCDPMVLDSLSAAVERPFHVIASWHVFMQSRVQRFVLPRVGGFSVYREGMDRESLKCATRIIAEGKFPLVIFGEGIVTRSNDRLVPLMEGPTFMARAALKQRKEGKVVIHPVFTRYFYEGNLEKAVLPVIQEIENRLSWQPQAHLSLRDRITKIGHALLSLKEMEYLHDSQTGTFPERLDSLVDRLLGPLEQQWTGGRKDVETMARVKRLRTAILPEMVSGELTEAERTARWRQLTDLYLVQQLHCYPGNYISDHPSPERILETVERYEEDLKDISRAHAPIHAVICVGDAVEVTEQRDRSKEGDPVTHAVRAGLETLLETSKAYRRKMPSGLDRLESVAQG